MSKRPSIAEHIDAAPDLASFRERVDAFLQHALPQRLADIPRTGIAMPVRMQLEWQTILDSHGLGAPGWARENGGRGWPPQRVHVWMEACARARAPRHVLQTISMIGPILNTYGTPEQKRRHLPGILSGKVLWCQGYSEPSSGSDLASLRTTAIRAGDTYRVTGQKIWTTYAHEADWIFALVRTNIDVPLQQGISFLLIDMKSPGIRVRPIVTIDGLHHLNEVFFDDVEVPAENLVGEADKGWRYAKSLLDHERLGICDPTELMARAAQLKAMASSAAGNALLGEGQGAILAKLAALDIRLAGFEAAYAMEVAAVEFGHPATSRAAALKFIDTEITQEMHEIMLEMAGPSALADQSAAFDPASQHRPIGAPALVLAYAGYAFSRANSIAGGTSEVQKNIIWRAIAG